MTSRLNIEEQVKVVLVVQILASECGTYNVVLRHTGALVGISPLGNGTLTKAVKQLLCCVLND
jgi:hypothetical protein